MLIKNNSARVQHIGGKQIAPNEVKEVPDNWKNALKVEFETGELTLVDAPKEVAQESADEVQEAPQEVDEVQEAPKKRGPKPKDVTNAD